jgi:hypothetical protein
MTKEDFKFESNHWRASIYYKDKFVTGWGTLQENKQKHWRHKRADSKENYEACLREIDRLINDPKYRKHFNITD